MHGARRKRLLIMAAVSFLTAACSHQPHNNVLLFGTDTKFALDVSTEATQGGMPEITLGYKRREAVWLPLARNNQSCTEPGSVGTDCSTNTDVTAAGLYKSEAQGISPTQGGSTQERDAYSVFASFGATLDSGANAGEQNASASVGLAQFFATGIAAQRLGANPSVADALAVKPPDSKELVKAQLKAEDAEAEAAQLRLQAALGEEAYKKSVATGQGASETKSREIALIVACARPGDPTGKAGPLIDSAKTKTTSASVISDLESLRSQGEATWRSRMQVVKALRRALLAAYGESC